MKLNEIARFTNQLEETVAFYETLLGKAPQVRSEGMAIFMLGEVKLFLHRSYQPAEGELPPEDHLAFEVEHLDTACQRLVSDGLLLVTPPEKYYWGRSAYLRAPDGQLIELVQADNS